MTPIRLLVVDDHTLFRRGLIALLSQDPRFAVVGEAGDAGEAQRRAQALQPDLILLDNHLPGVRGVDALPGLREAAPQARVLMLTVSEDERDLAAALRAGADGYLLKTADSEALAQAIVQIRGGQSVVSPEMTGKLVAAFQAAHAPAAAATQAGAHPPAQTGAHPVAQTTVHPAAQTTAQPTAQTAAPTQTQTPSPAEPPDPIDNLSPREHEILAHIARGASNKEIARALDIAETTVKIHVQHILRKLGLSSRVQAAVYITTRPPRR